MKTRIQKYYIESQSGGNRSLICANKLKNAKGHLPTDEQITNHMLYEKLACKNDKERRPKPLLIMVENRIFNALVDELVNEKKWHRVWNAPCVPLTLQSSNIPIALIISRDDINYFKNFHY